MLAAAAASILPDPFDWMHEHQGVYTNHITDQMAPYASHQNDFHLPESDSSDHHYSYQHWQAGDRLLAEGRVVAANHNPLSGSGGRIPASEALQNADCHGNLGQNVLFGDGSVDWLESAQIDGDRLWDPGTDDNGHILGIITSGSRGQDVIFLVH